MPRTHRSRTGAAGAALILILLALALAACGSGSNSSTTAATTITASTTPAHTSTAPTSTAPTSTAPTNTSTNPTVKQLTAGVAKLRACLAKYGVPLPKAGGYGSGQGLPTGVTLAQAEAALRTCAGAGAASTVKASPLAGKTLKGLGGGAALASSLERLFACLRQQGVQLAEAKGSLGGLAKLNLQDPKVKAAIEVCRTQLKK
jgi:hypothetical protein